MVLHVCPAWLNYICVSIPSYNDCRLVSVCEGLGKYRSACMWAVTSFGWPKQSIRSATEHS